MTYICVDKVNLEDVPTTVTEALSRPDREYWKQAMQDEIGSFEENKAWKLIDPTKSVTVVQCKWVFKRKIDQSDKVSYCARLVAKGFCQKPGIDYNDTFAPVVRHSTLRLMIALAVKLGLRIDHLDIKTAFLNGYLNETVYMEQPEGFIKKGNEQKICKLYRAIYGLKQSSNAWNKRIDIFFIDLCFTRSKHEPCLYIYKKKRKWQMFICNIICRGFVHIF